MSTVIRPEVSDKKPYYISKHRYYELKHFCLQYNEFKDLYFEITSTIKVRDLNLDLKGMRISDETFILASKAEQVHDYMSLIERTAYQVDSEIGKWIFESVTKGLSYTHLKMVMDIPCGKDLFYDRYRKYFWMLNLAKK